LGHLAFTIEMDSSCRVQLLYFTHMPDGVSEGDVLHVVLDDGREVECSMIDGVPLCAVVRGPTA
jgi:hypothetical protein